MVATRKYKKRKSLCRMRRCAKKNRTKKGGRAFFTRLFSKSTRVAPEPTPTPTPTMDSPSTTTSTYESLIDKYKKEIASIRTQLTHANANTSKQINAKELPGNNPTQITVSVYREHLYAIIRDATAKLDMFDNEIQNIQDDFTQKSSSVTDAKQLDTLKREFKIRARRLHGEKLNLGLHAIKYNVITGLGSSIVTLTRNLEKGKPDPFTGLRRSKQPTLH
jgi:hypothetical protein